MGLAGLQVAGGTVPGAGEQFPSSAKQVILDSGTSALLVSKTDADSIHMARAPARNLTSRCPARLVHGAARPRRGRRWGAPAWPPARVAPPRGASLRPASLPCQPRGCDVPQTQVAGQLPCSSTAVCMRASPAPSSVFPQLSVQSAVSRFLLAGSHYTHALPLPLLADAGRGAQRIPGLTKTVNGMWMVDGGCANVHTLPSVSFNLGTADAPKYFDIPPILWTKPVRLRFVCAYVSPRALF